MLGGSLQSRVIKSQTLPLSSILRPIPPVLDARKIDSMAQTLKNETPDFIPSPAPESIIPGQLPPVDVLHYRSSTGKDFYFAFGGCHRMQAYEKAQVEGVNCKVLRVTKPMLKVYLGGSVGAIVGD
ncbi:ParB/Sulfiredoxin, partial [Trichophaea hybrida]